MPEAQEVDEVNCGGLDDHPAVRAWRRLAADRKGPTSIRTLKKEGHKSAVYRLAGVGPAGCDVVVKRCLPDRAAIEWTIYRDVLPQLPLSALHCYGAIPDDDGPFHWLFLEDAGDIPCALEQAEHRDLALRWLAVMHTSAQRVPVAASLPGRGAASYLESLRTARDMTHEARQHPALRPDDVVTLDAVLAASEALATRWRGIERFCDEMPRTLVHGDIVRKNLRIRSGLVTNDLWVMDWEKAGWGVPAADFAECVDPLNPDVSAYFAVVESWWPRLDVTALQRLASVGVMFRAIDALVWTNRSFAMSRRRSHGAADSVQWYVEQMRWHEARLSEWMGSAIGLEM